MCVTFSLYYYVALDVKYEGISEFRFFFATTLTLHLVVSSSFGDVFTDVVRAWFVYCSHHFFPTSLGPSPDGPIAARDDDSVPTLPPATDEQVHIMVPVSKRTRFLPF